VANALSVGAVLSRDNWPIDTEGSLTGINYDSEFRDVALGEWQDIDGVREWL
jgi:hypothetical protein